MHRGEAAIFEPGAQPRGSRCPAGISVGPQTQALGSVGRRVREPLLGLLGGGYFRLVCSWASPAVEA